jgi:lincosamide nucleotidyltransferase A/C/D/E
MGLPSVEGMQLSEVFRVLYALAEAGVACWLEGGWGVDALVGRQTRPHRDVDIDIDASQEPLALRVLTSLGYQIETDWRPNRVELSAASGRVDVHPLLFDPDGNARQPGLNGVFHDFPNAYFVTGKLAGRPVGCFSVEAQLRFHTGYDLRPEDAHDLRHLSTLRGNRHLSY